MTRRLTIALLVAVCGVSITPNAVAQGGARSIDCARVMSAVDEIVCRDAALTSLDRKLVDVYATASKTATSDQKNRLAADQQRWLSERDACSKSSDKAACAKVRYLQRIAELRAQFKLVASRGPFHFVCNGDPGNVLVAQYFGTGPATARFTHDGRTVTAFIQRSGSGALYGGPSVSYWEH